MSQRAIERVTQELSKEGFGILTEIDVAASSRRSVPCFPATSCRGWTHRGKSIVEIMDSRAMLELVERPEIASIAGEVRTRLERVLAAV
jgi:hypothetical protein